MKYKAKKINKTEWAVCGGKKYFSDTVTTNENDANIQACERSANWYKDQIDKCKNEWEKLHKENGKTDNFNEVGPDKIFFNFDQEWENVNA